MRELRDGTEYWTEFSGHTPGLYSVWIHRDGHTFQLGTVEKVSESDWAYTSFGVFFASGKNATGRRSTLTGAAEAVVVGTRKRDGDTEGWE